MMISSEDMITINQAIYIKSYITQAMSIPDSTLRNISLEESRHVAGETVLRMIQAVYQGKPITKSMGATIKEAENIPVNWWHMLLDRLLPSKSKSRKYLRYRTISTRTEQIQQIYNVCPHMDTGSEIYHSQWLGSDPEQSMSIVALLHALRNGKERHRKAIWDLMKVWHSQVTAYEQPQWQDMANAIAVLIEAVLSERE